MVTRKNRIPNVRPDDAVADPVPEAWGMIGSGQVKPTGVAAGEAALGPRCVDGGSSSVCSVCGRPLRSRKSIAVGMGPVCAGKA